MDQETPNGTSPIQGAIQRGLQSESVLREELRRLSTQNSEVRTVEEVDAICAGLHFLIQECSPLSKADCFHEFVFLFQSAETEAAHTALRESGIPLLLEAYDIRYAMLDSPNSRERLGDDLLFALKIFAIYHTDESIDRIIKAARRPMEKDGYLWHVVFSVLERSPQWAVHVCESLCDPLPDEFIGIAYLDMANTLSRGRLIEHHPFDCVAGLARLEEFLADTRREHSSRGVSAAASIPFLNEPNRSALLGVALHHPDSHVQIEAAWAASMLGRREGDEFLIRAAADPHRSDLACRYLTELGKASIIPAVTNDPDFAAMAKMSQWLQHPCELGEVPVSLELFDKRVLYWPPTEDYRPVWLFKYVHVPQDDRSKRAVGVGMVGSITFALFSENSADLTPEDIYALHCCWELMQEEHEEAPEQRTVENGRRILRKHNKGF